MSTRGRTLRAGAARRAAACRSRVAEGVGARLPLLALVAVTAIWGVTFVLVKDALVLYPLFAFLAVRFAISTVALAPFAVTALRALPARGWVAGGLVGLLLAAAFGLQTAGLELTTVASTGFITGLYVVFTPILALALFGTPVPRALWLAVALAVAGLALLSGVPEGSTIGNLLVLASALATAFQIAALERLAPLYGARALTFLMMATSFVAFTVVALALGDLPTPRGWTVWSALLATGLFAGALGYLIATWVQARTTAARAALVFTLEAPFAALAGVLLAGEVLGVGGWVGCAVMMAAILVAEPAAADALRRRAFGRRVLR
ncbi:MAG: DMT family transporter [Thermoleophilia bacterium]|nr:DMT family transporter [Gaiellaceae bacterium]MDW8338615.1 DMT family transporter [Thermoleophilia bacterium]